MSLIYTPANGRLVTGGDADANFWVWRRGRGEVSAPALAALLAEGKALQLVDIRDEAAFKPAICPAPFTFLSGAWNRCCQHLIRAGRPWSAEPLGSRVAPPAGCGQEAGFSACITLPAACAPGKVPSTRRSCRRRPARCPGEP